MVYGITIIKDAMSFQTAVKNICSKLRKKFEFQTQEYTCSLIQEVENALNCISLYCTPNSSFTCDDSKIYAVPSNYILDDGQINENSLTKTQNSGEYEEILVEDTPLQAHKDFPCSYCHHVFSAEHYLKEHYGMCLPDIEIASHKDFGTKSHVSDLNEYVKEAHIKIKLLKWSLCEFAFTQNCDLIKHVEKEHYVIKCDLCTFATSQKRILRKHLIQKHTFDKLRLRRYSSLQN